MRNLRDALCARSFDSGPQMIGHCIMISIVLDVMANAIAPHIGPSKALQHGDDGFALLIGDGVEGLAGLIHSLNLLNDRMAGGEGIQRHGLFLAVDLVEFDMPFGVAMRGRLALHPAREAFIEPKFLPTRHSHQIDEPLMRHFIRQDHENALLRSLRWYPGVIPEPDFKVEDRAPSIHTTQKPAL